MWYGWKGLGVLISEWVYFCWCDDKLVSYRVFGVWVNLGGLPGFLVENLKLG